MKQVIFELTRRQTGKTLNFVVQPTTPLDDFMSKELILIAARCLRQVGQRHGLDAAFETLNNAVYELSYKAPKG